MNVFQNPYTSTPQMWSAQQASISFAQLGVGGGKQGKPADILGCLLGVTIQFQRQLTTRYPIGSATPIKMGGVPRGTITLNTIVGPTTAIENFLNVFGHACNTFMLTIKMSSRKTTAPLCMTNAKPQTFKCTGCTGSAITYQIQSTQDGMSLATGQFNIDFTALDISTLAESGSTQSAGDYIKSLLKPYIK